MDLKPGQTVLLKDTRERARVVEVLEGDRFVVEADLDRERFEVHADQVDPAVGTGQRVAKAPAAGAEAPRADLALYPDPDGSAVQLACLPLAQLDYDVALLNFSTATLMYSARHTAAGRQQWTKRGLVGPASGVLLGYLYRDHLNESAEVEVQTSRKTASGTDSLQSRTVRLKPKTFFKNARSVSWYEGEVTVFDVFARAAITRAAPPPRPEPAPEVAHAPEAPAAAPRRNAYGVTAAAEFPESLDLHAGTLLGDTTGMSAGEIVEAQLRHVGEYLETAIRVGVPKVYIVHGKGSGALRRRVHELLGRMGDIEGFRGEYHPRFGHGATTVQLLPEG